MKEIEIMDVRFSNIKLEDALCAVKDLLVEGNRKIFIATPNPEVVMMARKNSDYQAIINSADMAIPDGVGIILAGKILGTPFQERITGVDFMLGLCKMAAENGFTVGLLGGREGVARKAADKLQEIFPGLEIVFTEPEWDINKVQSSIPRILSGSSEIKVQSNGNIDILFVAYGAPKQEKWIASNIKSIPVRVAMGVGGSFDYLAGIVPRAPLWVRKLGFEWLFRLLHEPWRFKRQLAIWKFGFLVFKQKFFG